MANDKLQICNVQSLSYVISVTKQKAGKVLNVFKGLGNLANIGSLMKQAQEMGAAGGGLVEVDVNGLSDVLAVRIDPSLVEKGEREMIEDLLPAAFNAAQAKAKQMHAEALQRLAGGLPMGGFADILSQLPGVNPDADKL